MSELARRGVQIKLPVLWRLTQPNSFCSLAPLGADKLMVSTALILLVGRYGALMAVPTAVILSREIAVSALREFMSGKGKRGTVKVGMQGKVKTAFQMAAIIGLLLVPFPMNSLFGIPVKYVEGFFATFMGVMYVSAVLTITSGLVYFIAAKDDLMGSKSE